MKRSKHNVSLIIVFLIYVMGILWVGNEYKSAKIQTLTHQQLEAQAKSFKSEIATLIAEKQNATRTLAITLTQDKDIAASIENPQAYLKHLSHLVEHLKLDTDYKNVWIQLVSPEGVSLGRTWSSDIGDSVKTFRMEVQAMLSKPEVMSLISVGKYDLSFKTMVPIFNSQDQFIAFIEVITHFNSIAEKLKAKGVSPVFLVSKGFKKQITQPFSGKFSGDNYIANHNADDNLLLEINKNGLAHYISENQDYMIDDSSQNLVIHSSLFDNNQNLLADILLFKPLKDIDLSAIEKMTNNINLLMVLAILSIAFLFYFVAHKKTIASLQHADEKNFRWIFLMAYLVVVGVFIFLLNWNFSSNKSDFIKQYNADIKRDYEIFYQKLNDISLVTLESIVKRPEVLALIARAYGTADEKTEARKNLYALLKNEYEVLKEFDIKQLHFHLVNNESFLRFHRPEKFGDNLSDVRKTVAWVNEHHQPIQGFEEGRIYNGFRYVYPLQRTLNNGEIEHLGSVEISFTAHAITKEFANFRAAKVAFIMKESLVQRKVFKSEINNYIPSDIPGYLAEKQVFQTLITEGHSANFKLFKLKNRQQIAQQILKGDVFSIESDEKTLTQPSLFSFIPLRNPITDEIAAAIVIQQDHTDLVYQVQFFQIILLAGLALISFLFMFFYKETLTARRYQALSDTTQQILDTQDSIMVITNGVHPLYVNQVFLKFTGYDTLPDFMEEHDCVCDFFVKDDRFFHLGKVKDRYTWPKEILKLSSRKRLVCMLDTDKNPHIFALSISLFNENYIFNFSDITDTMTAHFSLEQKVIHDPLTAAYNREYFNQKIGDFYEYTVKNGQMLGMIFLDIDHFKRVNDTYGHNIGDMVLKNFVAIIKTNIRESDILVRWGGEEFLVLMNVNSEEELFKKADKIRLTISLTDFPKVQNVTASLGVTLYKHPEAFEETVHRADQALYQAKHSGRNTTAVF